MPTQFIFVCRGGGGSYFLFKGQIETMSLVHIYFIQQQPSTDNKILIYQNLKCMLQQNEDIPSL